MSRRGAYTKHPKHGFSVGDSVEPVPGFKFQYAGQEVTPCGVGRVKKLHPYGYIEVGGWSPIDPAVVDPKHVRKTVEK